MLNDTVIKGQEIYNKDKKIIGVISKLSNDSFSGLVTSSTNFNLTSLNSDIYLMFDISKTSYYYTSYFYVNYEIICDYVKNLLLKLQTENTHHNIHIIFYIRIFFKSKNDYTKYDAILIDSSGRFIEVELNFNHPKLYETDNENYDNLDTVVDSDKSYILYISKDNYMEGILKNLEYKGFNMQKLDFEADFFKVYILSKSSASNNTY